MAASGPNVALLVQSGRGVGRRGFRARGPFAPPWERWRSRPAPAGPALGGRALLPGAVCGLEAAARLGSPMSFSPWRSHS